MAFENLDLLMNPEENLPVVFGWEGRRNGNGERYRCWYETAMKTISDGWDWRSAKLIEKNLASNVGRCYFRLCSGTFHDLDDDRIWQATFINDHNLWLLTLKGSPDAETLPEDAEAFFKSEMFMKFAKRCGDLVDRAKRCYHEVVEPKLRDGQLMDVDVIKLERILHLIDTKQAMENLRTGKYELK